MIHEYLTERSQFTASTSNIHRQTLITRIKSYDLISSRLRSDSIHVAILWNNYIYIVKAYYASCYRETVESKERGTIVSMKLDVQSNFRELSIEELLFVIPFKLIYYLNLEFNLNLI